MRTVLALTALAAVAATTSVEAQTCTNASLAFITESTGPFVQQCAAVVTAPALVPFAGAVALTDLLNPAATVGFLGSKPIADPVNFAFDQVLKFATGSNLSTIVSLSQGAFSAYPASSQNPYGYNFTRLTEFFTVLFTANLGAGAPAAAAELVSNLNGTMLGVSNYVLCPTLKNITQSLIGCVPSNCNNLALGLCQNPTAATAAQLMGVYADKPFTIGTLAILANIGASCAGGLKFYNEGGDIRAGLQAAFGYSFTASSFDVSCSVLANPALAGTFQYPATKSPTTKSAGAVLGAGVLAAVAAVASVVAL